jgi:pyruvate-ferredoxin/flavodoxin oxidoreductase
MAEYCDAWSAENKPNIWGTVPSITEMQSEAGAAGALHGALTTGSLGTTFTCSQGLLLMIPNMYKIAGELLPCAMHVTARSLATSALSIFGDHGDIMSVRQTGYSFLCSNSVQEAQDMALIAQASTLESRVPFIHFFDGFRTSHEIQRIETLSDDDIRAMIDEELVLQNRRREMTPDHPVLRGTAQNPDHCFQGREASNTFYAKVPGIVQKQMDKFAELTGRKYKLYEYYGAPDAEQVIVIMCSGGDIVHETVDFLNKKGAKTGVLKVRLFRPFDVKSFAEALPASVKTISVLDRSKESASIGEALYMDTQSAMREALDLGLTKANPRIIGGRYGISSAEFTPAMVKAVFDNGGQAKAKNHFTIGINDDVTHTSLPYDESFSTEPDNVVRAMFYGLGSDGTVGANKNSIKIIGENTGNYSQGYFVYDSRKAGAMTVSHLRFGPDLIRSSYLVSKSNFIACHTPTFLERYDMLRNLIPGGTFLLNSSHSEGEVWNHLPKVTQENILKKKAKFYVIDAYKVAHDTGMGGRINTIMQVCFFAISGVLPRDKAIEEIKNSIKKTYGKKGDEVVKKNIEAVDQTLANLHEVKIPDSASAKWNIPDAMPADAPEFVRKVLGTIAAGRGAELPVSAFPVDGTFPTDTSKYDKRNIAQEIPVWDSSLCIQCGKCSFVCPHAVIRQKAYDADLLAKAPKTFKSTDAKDPAWKPKKFTVQVAPEDCTGCTLCAVFCPSKDKTDPKKKALMMMPQAPLLEAEKENWNFFLSIPAMDRSKLNLNMIKSQQQQEPLFQFPSSCQGCGETAYVKLVSQLFGDRMVVANATGCSSIYGGNLPTTPWSKDAFGRGPTWCNNLFEDNAEFGLGFRLSIDKQKQFASEMVAKMAPQVGEDLAKSILSATQKTEPEIYEQRVRVEALKAKLKGMNTPESKRLLEVADMLVKKSVWLMGGDGWAYDIGYGGLDHVLSTGRNVNILVLDTEVYSNTGGQMSKSTPRGASARFAVAGKQGPKKDLGLMAMSYGNVYVARIAMGAKDDQTLKAIQEAEAYDGPSLIIAYSHCVAHGYDLSKGLSQQKMAVDSGQWVLYRYNPEKAAKGENPLSLDSGAPKITVEQYMMNETRFKSLTKSRPEEMKVLIAEAQKDAESRWRLYQQMAAMKYAPEIAAVAAATAGINPPQA